MPEILTKHPDIVFSTELGKMTQLAPTDVCKTAAQSSNEIPRRPTRGARHLADDAADARRGNSDRGCDLLVGYFGLRRK